MTAGVWHAPLVGRAGALTTLAEAAVTARAGLTTLVTVWGETGLGKSRLVEEAAALAGARDLEVIEVRARRLGAAAAGLAGAPGPGDPDDAARADAAALEVLAAGHDAAGTAAARYAPAPGAMRQAAARALARMMRGGEGARPRAIIVDDAHAADPVVLDAIELATMRADGGLVIVALARPQLAQVRPAWGRRAARHDTLRLAPLLPADGRALARALLPEIAAVPVAALDRLVRRCGGVPLLIGEVVRSMARNGLAVPGALDADGTDAPPGLHILGGVVDDELAALPAAVVQAAEVLAAVASPVRRADVAVLLRAAARAGALGDVDPDAAAPELARAGLVVEHGGMIDFRHELVRAAVARRPPAWRRIAIHRAVLASGIALEPDERAAHLEGCGESAAAAAAWSEAADAAAYDDLAVERASTRALACAGAPDPAMLRRRAAARARLGRHEDAAADFAAARAAAPGRATPDDLDALLDEAAAHDAAGQDEPAAACARAARRMFDEARAAAGKATEPSPVDAANASTVREADAQREALQGARIALAIGRAAWRRGDGGAALAPWREALVGAERIGDAGYATAIACRLMLGLVLAQRGCVQQASSLLDGAMDAARERGDLANQAAVLANRYAVHAARGDAAAVRRDLAEYTALARELGDAAMAYRGEVNQAFAAMWCDDDAAAGEHAAAAAGLEHRDPGAFRRPRGSLLLAELAARAGDRGTAARWLDTACTHTAAAAAVPADALMIEALAAWLHGWHAREVGALAGRAIAMGQAEVAFELYELYARDRTRAGDHAGAARARHDARTIPPALPKFLSAPPA